MKKYLMILVLFSLLLCAVSCGKEQTTLAPTSSATGGTTASTTIPTASSTTPPSPPKTVYDILGELAQLPYLAVSIEISTASGGVTLTSQYNCTEAEVSYHVEQLAKLPTDGNPEHLSPDAKTVLSGSVQRESGKPTYLSAIGVTVPTCSQLATGFDLDPRHFCDVAEEEGKLSATLVSPEEFLGAEGEILFAHIEILYTPAALSCICITYTTPTSEVSVVYTFSL